MGLLFLLARLLCFTGLLKGFSDNMDKEGLRRQAMRDRFDGYETMAVDAVLKGDATTGGLDAIRNLVQKANTEIDSMEPIGPFGARGVGMSLWTWRRFSQQ